MAGGRAVVFQDHMLSIRHLGGKKMNWETIGVFAEVVAAVAIVVTLVYLVIELRRNTAATQSATHQQQVDTTVALNTNVSNDPQLATLIARANDDYTSLEPSEQIQLQYLYTSYLNMWHYQYSNKQKKFLDLDVFTVWDKGMSILLNTQIGIRETWAAIAHIYDNDFRNHVETEISRLGPVESHTGMLEEGPKENAP